MSTKQAYEQKLQARLDAWAADIAKLEAKASEAQADARIEYQKQVRELKSRQEEARSKLAEYQRAGEQAGADLKAGVEGALDALGGALKSASSRFRCGPNWVTARAPPPPRRPPPHAPAPPGSGYGGGSGRHAPVCREPTPRRRLRRTPGSPGRAVDAAPGAPAPHHPPGRPP